MSEVIPDAAVEAAARALYIDQGGDFMRWDNDGDESLHVYYQRRVVHILEAAAPYMRPDFREANLKAIAEELATPLQFRKDAK